MSLNNTHNRSFFQRLGECSAAYLLYCASLVVWLAAAVLATSNMGLRGLDYVKTAAIMICILSELMNDRFDAKSLLSAMVLFSLAPLLYAHNGSGIAALFVFAFCARRYDFEDLAKVCFISVLLTFAFVVLGSIAGFVSDTVARERDRVSLGFGWVTFPTHYFLNLVALYFYLRRDKLTFAECALILLIDVFLFLQTDTRNSCILVVVLVVSALVLRHRKPGVGRIAGALFTSQFVVMAILSAILLLGVDPYTPEGVFLDDVFSNRIRLTQQAMDTYGVTAFGQSVTWVTQRSIRLGLYSYSEFLYVDCSYLNILITHGWVVFAIALFLLTMASRRVVKDGDALLCFILLVFAVHAVVDPQLLDLQYCGFLLLLGQSFAGLYSKVDAHAPHGRRRSALRFAGTEAGWRDFENRGAMIYPDGHGGRV